jgi:SAM-dependent methyltransferase
MLERAAFRGLSYLVHAGAERLPFRSGSFDTVVAAMSWCFVGELAYGEIARVLKRGGRFVYQLRGEANARLHQTVWWARGLVARHPRADAAVNLRRFRLFAGLRDEKLRLERYGLRCVDASNAASSGAKESSSKPTRPGAGRPWLALAANVVITAEPV